MAMASLASPVSLPEGKHLVQLAHHSKIEQIEEFVFWATSPLTSSCLVYINRQKLYEVGKILFYQRVILHICTDLHPLSCLYIPWESYFFAMNWWQTIYYKVSPPSCKLVDTPANEFVMSPKNQPKRHVHQITRQVDYVGGIMSREVLLLSRS